MPLVGQKISELPLYEGKNILSDIVPFTGGAPYMTYKILLGELLNAGRTSLVGGGQTALDGVKTALESGAQNWIVQVGNVAYNYQLVGGSDAQDLPWVVRPLDFAASGKVFKAMDTFLPNVQRNGFVYPSADGLLTSTVAAGEGQLLIGGGASAPALGNITSTSGHLTVTNGPGTIQLTLTGGRFDGFANPTATIGLTAVNGSAYTAMRSDAAPALSQAIVPNWTGLHTFTAGLAVTTTAALGTVTSGVWNGTAIADTYIASAATWNAKQNALTFGNLTESTSSVLTITGGTGAVIGGGLTIQVAQASGSQSGYLSSADWTTFNSKQNAWSGLTTDGLIQATGATTVASTLTPSGLTSLGVNTITAAASTNLILNGGSSGAAVTVGQGTNAAITLATTGTGYGLVNAALAASPNWYDASFFISNRGTAGRVQRLAFVDTTDSGSVKAVIEAGPVTGASDGYMAIRIRDTERVRFSYGGNLLIGGTTDISGSGGLKVFGSTASTSTATGSLINAGGFGNAGAAYFGGTVYSSTYSSTGALTISPVSSSGNPGNAISITGGTSTATGGVGGLISVTTGAATGGSGAISGALNLLTGSVSGGSGYTGNVIIGSGDGGGNVGPGSLTIKTGDNGLTSHAPRTPGLISILGGSITGTAQSGTSPTGGSIFIAAGGATASVSGGGVATGGSVTIRAGAGTTTNGSIKLGDFNTLAVAITPDVTIASTTASSSTTSGALQVAGGVGIAGALYVGDSVFTTVSGKGLSMHGGGTITGASGNIVLLGLSGGTITDGQGIGITGGNAGTGGSGLGNGGTVSITSGNGASGGGSAGTVNITTGNYTGGGSGAGGAFTLLTGVANNSGSGGRGSGSINISTGSPSSNGGAGTSGTTQVGSINLTGGSFTGSGTFSGAATGGAINLTAGNASGSSGTNTGGSITLTVGTGTTNSGVITLAGKTVVAPANRSLASWLTTGALSDFSASTVTNSSVAATYASAVFHSFAQPTLAAANAATTTTDAATVYIAGGPATGTNQTITNSWGLWNVGKTKLGGAVTLADTTASTSTTTGSLINAGGFGNAGAAYFGSTVNVVGSNSTVTLDSVAPSGFTSSLLRYNGTIYLPNAVPGSFPTANPTGGIWFAFANYASGTASSDTFIGPSTSSTLASNTSPVLIYNVSSASSHSFRAANTEYAKIDANGVTVGSRFYCTGTTAASGGTGNVGLIFTYVANQSVYTSGIYCDSGDSRSIVYKVSGQGDQVGYQTVGHLFYWGGTSLMAKLTPNTGLALGQTGFGISSWTTTGVQLSTAGSTYTNTSTVASGTAASAVFNSFAAPTLAATNASVTTTDAATVYIAGGPAQGTNQTITNSWGLWNAGKMRTDGDAWFNSGATYFRYSASNTNNLYVGTIASGSQVTLYNTSNTGSGLYLEAQGQKGNIRASVSGSPQGLIVGATSAGTNTYLGFDGASAGGGTYINFSTNGGATGLHVTHNRGSDLITVDSGGNTTLAATTASTSTTTGALVVGGGVGIAGALYTGGTVYAGSGLSGSTQFYAGYSTTSGVFKVTGTNTGAIGYIGATINATDVSMIFINGNADGGFAIDRTNGTNRTTVLSSYNYNSLASPIKIEVASGSSASWTTTGALSQFAAATVTNSSAAATYASAVFHSFAQPTLAAANAATTTTDAATVYIAGGPATGTNQTITNSWGLWCAGQARVSPTVTATGTSNAVQIDATWSPSSTVNDANIRGLSVTLNKALSNPSGTNTLVTAAYFRASINTGGHGYTSGAVAGIRSGATISAVSGTVPNTYSIIAEAPVNSTGGNIPLAYGLYVEAHKLANVTTAYGIYQAGSSDINTFAGATTVSNSTASTSTTTGSLINSGGFGNAGAAYFGGAVSLTGGDLTVSRYAGGTITVYNTLNSQTAIYNVQCGTTSGSLIAIGSAYATSGSNVANSIRLVSTLSDLQIVSQGSNGIRFWTYPGYNETNFVAIAQNGDLQVGKANLSTGSWLTTGVQFNTTGSTYTNSSTAASGTAASAVFASFAAPALAATNASVTTTNAATVYIAGGPTAGTNQTITNSYGLWNVGSMRLDGRLVVTNTTAATSYTTGCATFAGGVGISGKLWVADQLDISGSLVANNTAVSVTAPGFNIDGVYAAGAYAATDPGLRGNVAFSTSYLYICTGTNTWKRISLESYGASKSLTLGMAGGDLITDAKVYANGGMEVTGTLYAFSGVAGTATNDNAAAGCVGEFVSATLAQGSAITLTTTTAANVTSISLTAGDWDVTGAVAHEYSSANLSQDYGGSTATSATLNGLGSYFSHPYSQSITGTYITAIPVFRYSLSATTTVYLVAQSNFSSGTAKAYGYIRARRVR